MIRWMLPTKSVILCVALACSSEPEAEPKADAQTCPAKATSCPTGCDVVSGRPLDPVNNCVGSSQTIACRPATGIGGNLTVGCVQDDSQGTHYVVDSTTNIYYLVGTGEWSTCGAGSRTLGQEPGGDPTPVR